MYISACPTLQGGLSVRSATILLELILSDVSRDGGMLLPVSSTKTKSAISILFSPPCFRIDIHRMPPRLECDEVSGAYSLFLPEFTDRDYRLAVCIEQADALEPVLNILN